MAYTTDDSAFESWDKSFGSTPIDSKSTDPFILIKADTKMLEMKTFLRRMKKLVEEFESVKEENVSLKEEVRDLSARLDQTWDTLSDRIFQFEKERGWAR